MGTHPVFVFLRPLFTFYMLRLSVNHYLEKVPIIMLVRFKPAEESEKLCTGKKDDASNKKLFQFDK